MRLVIKSDSVSPGDSSMSGEHILAGHDQSQCQLCFAREQWPTVARVHAEFRVINGVCHLLDLGSGLGTFVDGRSASPSAPVRINSRIQFGTGGPVVTVQHIELMDSMPPPDARLAAAPAARPRMTGLQPEPAKIVLPVASRDKRAPAKPPYLDVEGDYPANVKRFELNKDVVRFGRAPELDLVFNVAATVVSRRHAEVRRTPEGYLLSDLGSFNGTLLNRKRIAGPCLLQEGDTIQLGPKGPSLRFHQQSGLRLPAPTPVAAAEAQGGVAAAVANAYVGRGAGFTPRRAAAGQRVPVKVVPLESQSDLVIGRAAGCDVQLDSLQISKRHARLTAAGPQLFVEDAGSTNGVYVNGLRLTGRTAVGPQDAVQIGPYLLYADPRAGLEVFDPRAQMRIDAVSLTRVVGGGDRGETLKLLDDVSLTIPPNEFVGLLGSSGAGKSTLIGALNGTRPATAGQVFVNSLDLYRNIDWLKQSIGYVPPEDIVHRELTTSLALYYVARLRLAADVSEAETERAVAEVLEVTGLAERRHVPVARLSGEQRKRLCVAVELLTVPSIVFLDEPTSGLDPAAEEKLMVLLRQIAESGHTVVLTTHATESVRLFDKVVVLMRGRLVFYGTPHEALGYFKAASFKELYDKLEEPVARQAASLPLPPADSERGTEAEGEQRLARAREAAAEAWQRRFRQTPQYESNVVRPRGALPQSKPARPPASPRATLANEFAQWKVLSLRHLGVLRRDRLALLMLFAQAPLIALVAWLADAARGPRDFILFVMALAPVWFGMSVGAREVIRERAVYDRERVVNLGLLPYVGSKLAVLGMVVSLQCLLLFATLKFFELTGRLELPGLLNGLPQLAVMMLAGLVGVALGLLISSAVKTSEMAARVVPLILVPQILLAGLVGVPSGAAKPVGALMPTTWAFDEMKRLTADGVGVLRGADEGGAPTTAEGGRGLYKQLEHENAGAIDAKARELEAYRVAQEDKVMAAHLDEQESQARGAGGGRLRRGAEAFGLDPPPGPAAVKFPPDDLSRYVGFLHPWGGVWLNPLVLLLMFFLLAAATCAVLRAQDIR